MLYLTCAMQAFYCTVLITALSTVVKASPNSHKHAVDAAERFMNRGMFEEALKYFQLAISYNDKDSYSMQGAATALSEMGRFVESGKYFENIAVDRGMPQFLMNAGISYERGRDLEKALSAYSACLSMADFFRPCHIKIAGVYNQLGHFVEVQKHLQYAIQLDPTDFAALNYLGDTYNNLKHFSLAIETYKRAIPIAGDNLGLVLTAIADTFSNRKQYIDAKEYYDQAIAFYSMHQAPTDLIIGSLFNRLQLGDWSGYERAVKKILIDCEMAIKQGNPSPLSPYRALFLPISPISMFNISRSWAEAFLRSNVGKSPLAQTQVKRNSEICSISEDGCGQYSPLKVGYISRRFEDYPGTQMMLRLFSAHNRSAVNIGAYAHGPDDGSSYRRFIMDNSDYFKDVSAMQVEEVVSLIDRNRVDVLVDYDGMHDFNSAKVLLQRPASVQMTWLGFAASTGFKSGEAIDYIIADKFIAAPDVLGRHFSERLVLMPGTYQPQDEHQGLSDVSSLNSQPFAKSNIWFDAHLRRSIRLDVLSNYASVQYDPDFVVDKFWYICFNRVEKITPAVFNDWMQILHRRRSDTESILILMSQSPEIDTQIKVLFGN